MAPRRRAPRRSSGSALTARSPPKTPVKMMSNRKDDIPSGFYRPMAVHRARIGLKDGAITGWRRNRSCSRPDRFDLGRRARRYALRPARLLRRADPCPYADPGTVVTVRRPYQCGLRHGNLDRPGRRSAANRPCRLPSTPFGGRRCGPTAVIRSFAPGDGKGRLGQAWPGPLPGRRPAQILQHLCRRGGRTVAAGRSGQARAGDLRRRLWHHRQSGRGTGTDGRQHRVRTRCGDAQQGHAQRWRSRPVQIHRL